ncbi:hypothetical protein HPB49_023798 [Dermacentor silvarum]|uniref:Uncharacterized protein n=1 Tax=Dermacentor silvarum TaxID=543639 RepID=A0ACB8D8X3_DERSI|nr:hypothetical protein HPB49_023798 [Dermacentor silvarum]
MSSIINNIALGILVPAQASSTRYGRAKVERATPALAWLWFSLLAVVLGTKNCTPAYNATHTMCMEPYQNCTTYCSETALSNVIILWVHNHYRSHIALGQLANFPPAANMFQLRWDDDLAAVAGARGRDCVRSAGQFTDYFEQQWTADFPLVDQNLLIHCSNQMTPAVAWEHVVRDWFDQSTNFPQDQVGSHENARGAGSGAREQGVPLRLQLQTPGQRGRRAALPGRPTLLALSGGHGVRIVRGALRTAEGQSGRGHDVLSAGLNSSS